MSRTLTNPNAGSTYRGSLPIYNGGSAQDNAASALAILAGIPSSSYNTANGVAGLDGTGHLPYDIMPSNVSASIGLTGPELLYLGGRGVWTITNYDSAVVYSLTATTGFVSRSGGLIYYTAPLTAGVAGFTINGKVVAVTVDDRYVAKPAIITPLPEMINVGAGIIVAADTFTITGGFPEQILTASDKAANDSFSLKLSLSSDGTRLVASSQAKTVSGISNAGAVYIFVNNAGTWVQEQIITEPIKATTNYFGTSVSITDDGSRVAIGSVYADVSGTVDAGQVYVYSRSGSIWSLESTLSPADRIVSDYFGVSVALDGVGARLSIGSNAKDPAGVVNAGQVYIYTRSGTVWTLEATLTASDKATGDQLGQCVYMSSDGSRIAATAYQAAVGGISQAGAVYIFIRTGTVWTQEAKLTASDKAANDWFGLILSSNASFDTLAIRVNTRAVNGLVNAGAAYIFTRSGTTWIQEQILTASDKAANDYFGTNVSLSSDGTRLAVGAYNKTSDNVSGSGKIYLFGKSNGLWVEECKVIASDKLLNDYFGTTTFLTSNGDCLAVGAISRDSGGVVNSGAVYVYQSSFHQSTDWQLSTDPGFTTLVQSSIADVTNRRSWSITDLALDTDYYLRCRYTGTQYGTSEWSETQHFATRQSWLPIQEMQILTASDKVSGDLYGASIAISNDGLRLAVGVRNADIGGVSDTGAIYVYTRTSLSTAWSLEQKLSIVAAISGDVLGNSLDMTPDGTRIIAGAYQANPGGTVDAGAVYIFSRSGTVWSLETTLILSDKVVNDYFGYSVSITHDGSRAVIGATGPDNGAVTNIGAIYVYSRSGTVWTLETKKFMSDAALGDNSGNCVSISGDGLYIICGSYVSNPGGTVDAGAAYIFTRSGTVWTEWQKIIAADKMTLDYFVASVMIDGTGSRVVIAASGKTVGGLTAAGQVYVYSRSGSTWSLEQVLIASDKAAQDWFGTSVTITDDGSTIIVSSTTKTVNSLVNAGQIYIFKRTGVVWTQESILTASDKAAANYFGSSVAITDDYSTLAIGSSNRDSNGIVDSGAVYIFQ